VRDTPPSPLVSFHSATAARAILFGPFRFDARDRTLTREGQEIRLPPRALAILEFLLERPGRVVSKQDLIDAVWKDAFVSESSLTEAVGVLRQLLGDSAGDAAFIQTVHRRGYRFVAPVTFDAQSASALTGVDSPAVETVAGADSSSRPRWLLLAGILAAIVTAIAGSAWWYLQGAPAPRVTRTTITLPEAQAPAPGLSAQTLAAISPDGRRIVYVAGSTGNYRLFLRAIDQFDAVPIPGTESGHGPFFSPDGLSIAFFRNRHLLVMRLPDGQPLDLGPAGSGLGGWWHTDQTIFFATGTSDGIRRVPAQGGASTPVPVGGLNPGNLRHPSVTADGRTMLATLWKLSVRDSEVVAVDLETGASRVVGAGVHPRPIDDAHALYIRDNALVASSLAAAGDQVPLLTGVMTGILGAGQYALSADGTLLYLPHLPARMLRQLASVGPDGVMSTLPFEQRAFQNFSVSPDGRSLAATIYEGGAADLWVGDMERGTLSRLTTGDGTLDPVWAHDGRTLFFGSTRSGAFRINRMPANGSAPPSVVSALTGLAPTSERAGVLYAHRLNPGGDRDILQIHVEDGTWRPWLATAANEGAAKVSPDGRWMAYESNRTGRYEVYRRPVADGLEQQVSTEGAGAPSWSSDGRYIYFTSSKGLFRSDTAGPSMGRPEFIYDADNLLLVRPAPRGWVVLNALEETRPLTTINVVGNWLAEVAPRLRR
jgi:DNA-binding winged helix-turn-helix (wHTH) protein/Tol biopolymer transport system component